ncbi:MAG: hypothetical protein ABIG99_00785 [Patescibacteria group bacterium]
MNPKLVDGKYSKPIILDLDIIRNSTDPLFVKAPNVYATHFLEEIRGYYAVTHNVAPKDSGLSFTKIGNQLKIYGYTTAILKQYLKEECKCLPSVFDTYRQNNKFYILFITKKTDIEISGDLLTAFRMLHEKCYDENEYIKWDALFNKMGTRRNILLQHNLGNFTDTQEQKINYVYQTIAVKMARLLKNATGDPAYNEDNIIDNKYGGNYRLAM